MFETAIIKPIFKLGPPKFSYHTIIYQTITNILNNHNLAIFKARSSKFYKTVDLHNTNRSNHAIISHTTPKHTEY